MNLTSLSTWARQFGTGRHVELACAEHPDLIRGARDVMVVRLPGCLVDAPLELPLELLALGVESIALRIDGCDAAEATRHFRVDRWDALLAMVGHGFVAPRGGRAKRQVHAADAMPTVRRRTLFGLGRAPDAPPADAWRPDVAATHQQRLRAVLQHLGASSVPEAEELPGTGVVLAAAGCRAGGQCVQVCPNDALTLTTVDGESTLTTDPSLCDGCGRCIDFCDADALTAAGVTTLADLLPTEPVTLATLRTRRCERCRAPFTPDDDTTLCTVCTAIRSNPFGSSLPPEAIARLARQRRAADDAR